MDEYLYYGESEFCADAGGIIKVKEIKDGRIYGTLVMSGYVEATDMFILDPHFKCAVDHVDMRRRATKSEFDELVKEFWDMVEKAKETY